MSGQRAIATPHHLATEAGEQMFAQGGNAVDAALAAAAVLTVVYPHNTSIGGDLIALVSQDARAPEVVNAFGYAPANVDPAAWGTTGRVPSRGPESITLPGALKGWAHLHDNYATLPWSTLLSPAITHAGGYEIGKSVRTLIDDVSALSDTGRALMETMFGPDFATATRAANPALAATLTRLAEVGVEDFYTGQTATKVVDYLQTIRPDFTLEDFANYEVITEGSLTTEFAGLTVHTAGAPCQGFSFLRFLHDLRATAATGTNVNSALTSAEDDLAVLSETNIARTWMDSFTLSDALRDSILAEGVPGEVLLDPNASPHAHTAAPKADGDTIGIAVSDENLKISLIQSLYSGFGSLCFDEATGIVFQCRGAMFSLDPTSPQFVKPRVRPPHTLMPVIVTAEDNTPVFVQSTMGGKAQAQIHARIFAHLLMGETPAQAVAVPRWMSGPSRAATDPRNLIVEEDVPAELVAILAEGSAGEPTVVPPTTDALGHANIVDLRSETPLAASDPRSDGTSWVG